MPLQWTVLEKMIYLFTFVLICVNVSVLLFSIVIFGVILELTCQTSDRDHHQSASTQQHSLSAPLSSLHSFTNTTMQFVYRLTPSTKLIIRQGDITKFIGDAIVNAANERCLGGGGVDGAIHKAAGPDLRQECLELPIVSHPGIVRCPTGDAKTTRGRFGTLQVDWIIHTVGPVYHTSSKLCRQLLSLAYRSSLLEARAKGMKRIAFPAISCGVYGYPLHEAADISLQECHSVDHNLEEIHFYLFGTTELDVWISKAEEKFDRLLA